MIKKRLFKIAAIIMVASFIVSFSVLPSSATDTVIPSANFELSSYPMNKLTNENGVIIQFATSDETGSVQNYYEWVLNGNVKNIDIRVGFWQTANGYILPFLFYNKALSNRTIDGTGSYLYKYDIEGKLVASTNTRYVWYWRDMDFVKSSESSGYIPLSSGASFPILAGRMSIYESNASTFISPNTTSIRMLSGKTQTGVCLYYSSRSSYGDYYVKPFSNDANPTTTSPEFTNWWSDINVTVNGIAPVNPDLPNGGLTQEQINYNNYEINKINSNWLEKIYNKLSEIFAFLPELKGSGGGSDLTETNNAINKVGSQIEDINNQKPSEEFNQSQLDDYDKAEEDVNKELESLKEGQTSDGLSFAMDGEAISWVYDDVEDSVERNPKIFAVFLSILSMSLIMFVLNKGANA